MEPVGQQPKNQIPIQMKRLSKQEAEELEREMQNPPKGRVRTAVNPKHRYAG